MLLESQGLRALLITAISFVPTKKGEEVYILSFFFEIEGTSPDFFWLWSKGDQALKEGKRI